MTPEGYQKLMHELKRIKSVERPKIVAEIEVAREHGDISENAEFHAAKDKQAVLTARMRAIETKLAQAEVIDPVMTKQIDKIVFGATVTLFDNETEGEVLYKIVGDDETDIKGNKIGISSPLARGLIGKRLGDEVVIRTPKGTKEFEVLQVEYV